MRALLVALLIPVGASAQATLTQTGYLLDAADLPVDGAQPMRFHLFATASDTSALYAAPLDAAAACSVPVAHGYYAVVLGSDCGAPVPASVFAPDQVRYLEVVVGTTTLLPRVRIAAVPSASRAATSDDAQALATALSTPGVVNTTTNPVDWTKLKGVPAGFADGVDNTDVYAAGAGLALDVPTSTFSIANRGVVAGHVGSSVADSGKFLQSNGAGAIWTTVTSTVQVASGGGLAGDGQGTPLRLANTSVTPGTYANANVTVDAQGRVTAAAAGTGGFVNVPTDTNPTTSCTTAGALRWTGSTFQGCNGTVWLALYGTPTGTGGSGTVTFAYTGGDQGWRVPADVTSITVKLWGAGGAGGGVGGWSQGFPGGGGGFTTATVAVAPGEILTVMVGAGGLYPMTIGATNNYGGGGGSASGMTDTDQYAGGGGGRTAIRRSLTELVTAGGGGGGGSRASTTGPENGGAGGGAVGVAGLQVNGTASTGGTQSAGGTGAAGTSGNGSAGAALLGGRPTNNSYGGGGGGGWFGGGSGAHTGTTMGGGSGGSGYISAPGTTAATTTAGSGQTPPSAGDVNYVGIAGQGGNPSTSGGNGLAVIQYVSNAPAPAAQARAVFRYTGADQQFKVPSDVSSIDVKLWGAGGGGGGVGGWSQGFPGGGGGFATATVAVTPGESLNVIVGSGGGWPFPTGTNPNYGGGGGVAVPDTDTDKYCGSGGGRSALRRGVSELMTAGGGGGGASRASGLGYGGGGAGGGLFGQAGYQSANVPAGGGTSASGGSGGVGGSATGTAGGPFFGGRPGTNSYGGGGGGGYFGGGGGGHAGAAMGGGGGGSSYVSGPGVTNGYALGGYGQAIGNPGDADYIVGVGVGGNVQAFGGNGLAVITYTTSVTPPAHSTQIFSYTGSDQSFVVPSGVTQLTVKAWGAGGGGGGPGGWSAGFPGGGGGFTAATIAVVPNETLTIMVGQPGAWGFPQGASATYGGGGGWGGGGDSDKYGGSGGGRSAVRRAGADIVTAGGGGGGGSRTTPLMYEGGGAGGGLSGENGYQGSNTPATGATQSGPGSGATGTSASGSAGSQYLGGHPNTNTYGGGGGGGYYGGGGGAHNGNLMGGGGGGSGFVIASGTTWSAQVTGWTNLPPGTGDPDYLGGIAVGGPSSGTGGTGRVVLHW